MNWTAWHPRYLQQDRHRSLLALLLQKDAKGILNYWPFLCRLPPHSGSAMTRQRMEEICWKGKALNPVSQQDSTCCHLQAPRALCVWGVGSKSCDAQRPLTKGHGGFNVFSHIYIYTYIIYIYIYICSSRSQSHPEPLFRHELFVFMFLHVPFFWLHPCARFFEASKHIKQVWFLLLFWWPWWISSHYLPPRRVGLLRTLQLPWKLRAKGLRRVHRWCPHCPLQLGRHVSGQLCPPKIQWFTSFISFRFGVHFSFQDKAWQSNITNLEDPGVFYGVVTVDRRCSYSCLVCLAHFGSRRSQSYIHWSSFILSTCRYWWTPSFQCAFNVYAYIYIYIYNII